MSVNAAINVSAGGADPLALVARVDALLAELAAVPLWPAGDSALLDLAVRLQRVKSRLATAELAVVREIDVRGAAIAAGAASTAAWLRSTCRIRLGSAKRLVSLARAVRDRYLATGRALARGEVSLDAASVVVDVLDDLPDDVDDATLEAAEEDLLARALEHEPGTLAKLGRHLAYVLDPDGAREFEREEARQHAARDLQLNRDDRGVWHLRGRLDQEAGSALAAALDAVSRPRPSTAAGPDPRTAGQRRADGLAELVALATDSGKLPNQGGLRPTVVVQVSYAWLLSALGAAATHEDGTPLSPAAVRMAACDADILPMVMGGESQPLDVGRTKRTPPAHLRRAVLVRDGHRCATPGCGGRPRHCHHIVHWLDGGPTEIDNLVSLCGHCHRSLHARRPVWTIEPVVRGKPRFTRNGPSP